MRDDFPTFDLPMKANSGRRTFGFSWVRVLLPAKVAWEIFINNTFCNELSPKGGFILHYGRKDRQILGFYKKENDLLQKNGAILSITLIIPIGGRVSYTVPMMSLRESIPRLSIRSGKREMISGQA